MATRRSVLDEQFEWGYSNGVASGITTAAFASDGEAVDLLAGDRVVRSIPLR